MTIVPASDELLEYREDLFDDFGFTPEEASRLARATMADGSLVRPYWIQQHMIGKLAHSEIVDLLAPLED